MAKKKSDETKRQRLAFEFFGDHFREDKAFTLADLAVKTGWTPKTASTYLSKHFEPFTKPVPPILKGQQQKHQAYRVTDVLLMIGKWSKFRRHVSQKRKLTYEYDRTIYSTVLIFEFFLPLTNETVLRNELDALFFKNTIHKKLLTIGLVELKGQIEPKPEESDKDYWIALSHGLVSRYAGTRFRTSVAVFAGKTLCCRFRMPPRCKNARAGT